MSAFEAVTIIVALVALFLALVTYLRLNRVLDQFGRRGTNWFDHREDLPLAEQPDEDERDAPLPKRPIRGRPG